MCGVNHQGLQRKLLAETSLTFKSALKLAQSVEASDTQPYILEVHLNDVLVQMELDTGAAVSIITDATYKRIQRESFVSALQPADSMLQAYTGHHIQVLGLTRVKVRYDKDELCLPVHVVHGGGPNLD